MSGPGDATAGADIGVVVVTYQSEATIEECLRRLRDCAGVAAIRVVDNHSIDATASIARRHACADRRVRIIANPDNPGFGVACNQGAADIAGSAPECRWLAFVNPDALPEPDVLARLRELAVPLGPALLGADLVDEAGVRDPAARRRAPDFAAMLAGWRERGGRGGAAMAVAPDDRLVLQPVEAISGAVMFLPRALFESVGGFDQRYRLHAEDLDLCRRILATGAVVAVANHVRVLHVRGVSSRSRPVFVEWHKHRGLWRYFRTFEAPRRGVAVRVAVWLAIWARFPLAVARRWPRD